MPILGELLKVSGIYGNSLVAKFSMDEHVFRF
jgi:hypothetical protein